MKNEYQFYYKNCPEAIIYLIENSLISEDRKRLFSKAV
jgi:hypothetical protein